LTQAAAAHSQGGATRLLALVATLAVFGFLLRTA
jgi:hypothetical protein